MKRHILAWALCCSAALGQVPFNSIAIRPVSGTSTPGSISFYDGAAAFALTVAAPSSLSANGNITLPAPTGSAGCWKDDGFGNTTIASCMAAGTVTGVTGTSPIVSSGGTSPAISCPSCLTGISVGLTMPTGFTVSGSPANTGGTLAVAFGGSVAQNLFLASPNGSSGAPSFRAIVGADFSIPFTLSGSTSGNILNVTQSGSGNAAVITGNSSVTANTTGNTFTVTQSNSAGNALVVSGPQSSFSSNSSGTALSITQSGSGDAVQVSGTVAITGLLTQGGAIPLWYMQPQGISFARNYTSRYTFNSMGDVAQTGTFTASGSVITATSGLFDVSFTGGQISLCATTCTPSNGTLFFVQCYNVTANQCGAGEAQGTILLGSSPGFNGSFSYAANAFQTSQGTMYITGGGFGYFQNLVVTDGFTALGTVHLSGTSSWSGTSVSWVSGNLFDPSMQGGSINIASSSFIVTAVNSPTQLTLATSAGTGSGAYSYLGDSFRALDGSGNIVAKITPVGSFAAVFNKSVSVTNATSGSAVFLASNTGTGLAAEFGLSGGNVKIDNNLTVLGSTTLNTGTGILRSNSSGLITYSPVNLSSADITGNLPVGNLASGAGASSFTFFRGDGVWASPSVSTLTTPAIISSSTSASTPTVTITQSGTDEALQVNGPLVTSGIVNVGGNLLVGGTISGTHIQNTGVGDSVSFIAVSAATFNSGTISLQTTSLSGQPTLHINGSSTRSLVQIANSGGGLDLNVGTINISGSCIGSGCGVTSLSASGPLSSSASTGAVTISCSTCLTSVSGTSPITVSGSTVQCSSCVTSGSAPTFAATTVASLHMTGIGQIIDSSANYLANSITITGITSNSGGALVCVTGVGLLYRSSGGAC